MAFKSAESVSLNLDPPPPPPAREATSKDLDTSEDAHESSQGEEKPAVAAELKLGEDGEEDGNASVDASGKKGKMAYVCDICNKVLSRQSLLVEHKRKHTGEKPFECPTCNRKFTTQGSCARHTKLHTKEKTYACDSCPKKFFGQADLLRHSRIHSKF